MVRRIMSEDGPVDFGLMDGYHFGDRLLEGVMFKVTIDENNEIKVELEPGSKDYCEGLNMVKWMKEAKEFAEEIDVLSHPDPDKRSEQDVWIEETP